MSVCKYMFLVFTLLSIGGINAQNITDLSVMGEADNNAPHVISDDTDNMPQDVFPHPDRIKMDNRCIQLEGKDFFLLGGTMHYFRVAEPLWADRLEKLKAMGFNTVETYVPWNYHERTKPLNPDDFSHIDLSEFERFVSLAEDMGLYVIVRPGPYICAEWEAGGFPYWLMDYKPKNLGDKVWLQTNDPEFVRWSNHWFSAVAKATRSHQLFNRQPGTGGVILWQLENEYNRVKWVSSKDKTAYLEQLATCSRENGIEVPLITCWTDQGRMQKEGPLRGCVDMVNSYPRWNITKGFGRLIDRQIDSMPGKPLISGELQGGWYSAVGGKLSTMQDGVEPVQSQHITLYALERGFCGLNFYMTVGGTNFDDWASPEATATYDFAAAIGEDGLLNGRYHRFQRLAPFVVRHGTRIARAHLTHSGNADDDSLVNVSVRTCDNGDRYVFVRTEDHTHGHAGITKINGIGIRYDLEPFGAMVYYIRKSDSQGDWFPKGELQSDNLKLPAPVKLEDLPWRETKAKADRHFLYYQISGKDVSADSLVIVRPGEKAVNNSPGDDVNAVCGEESLSVIENGKERAIFRIPLPKGDIHLLYDHVGIHHHTNQAVEQHWHNTPQGFLVEGGEIHPSQIKKPTRKALKGLQKSYTVDFLLREASPSVYHLQIQAEGNGYIYLNGHCLGRYWQQGPQHEFYLPECWLNLQGKNYILINLHAAEKPAKLRQAQLLTFKKD